MHIVELLLQKLDLFFKGCLAVKALVVFLLGIFCLHTHAVDLDGLPDGFSMSSQRSFLESVSMIRYLSSQGIWM